MEHVSQIHGLTLSAWAFAGLTGNQLTNLLLGRFGAYEPVLLTLTVLYAVGLLLSALGIRPAKNTIGKGE